MTIPPTVMGDKGGARAASGTGLPAFGLSPSGFAEWHPSRNEHVFDFRRQWWGHAIHMPRIEERTVKPKWWRRLLGAKSESFQFLTCMGHSTPTPMEGDILLIPMQSGRVARWRVIETRYISDPRDMFDVRRADFAGYLDAMGA